MNNLLTMLEEFDYRKNSIEDIIDFLNIMIYELGAYKNGNNK